MVYILYKMAFKTEYLAQYSKFLKTILLIYKLINLYILYFYVLNIAL